ncbi:MAG: NAD kinase [Prevotellaceae bacterium]|jgi:NAD+ kinase|nr:NAD kinase [Prevotellaceae bacterium]
MLIAVNGRQVEAAYLPAVVHLLELLQKKNINISVAPALQQLLSDVGYRVESFVELPKNADYLISIGGDGTFLESVLLIAKSGIPVMGINTGRLGFLSNITLADCEKTISYLLQKKYTIEERSLLKVSGDFLPAGDIPYALNEIGIQKRMATIMINIKVSVNGEKLPDYWADGLLVSTPTGSTAYSMSVGGPIIVPEARCLLLSPIASHNLSTRPLIINDHSTIKVQANTRHNTIIISLDNRIYEVASGAKISIEKASFTVKTIRLYGSNFFSTLQEKLLWGSDKRNVPH